MKPEMAVLQKRKEFREGEACSLHDPTWSLGCSKACLGNIPNTQVQTPYSARLLRSANSAALGAPPALGAPVEPSGSDLLADPTEPGAVSLHQQCHTRPQCIQDQNLDLIFRSPCSLFPRELLLVTYPCSKAGGCQYPTTGLWVHLIYFLSPSSPEAGGSNRHWLAPGDAAEQP